MHISAAAVYLPCYLTLINSDVVLLARNAFTFGVGVWRNPFRRNSANPTPSGTLNLGGGNDFVLDVAFH